ncbi:hypothetical protein [Nocardiopsis composta]|uniref:Uncharacterized protein n=1 Tax=Nocardiopsis composta TaxID=157465 RepID=A0A7W8QIS7_9ACTN|nr:hypothetical protein [Nocardiopsis composta]MBB5430485.1 hypothetical protein [Nocardiopsis composta]
MTSTTSSRPAPRSEAARGGARIALLLGLMVLSPVCAEYLSAYDDSTGNPAALLGALIIFVPLYGAPALLIREAARRFGIGWPGIAALATAAGIMQAGVIDQSLFSLSYRNIDYWSAMTEPTLIAPLGLSAANAVAFIGGHAVWSFCAPIAVMEGIRPDLARRPWLRLPGTVAAVLLYLAAAGVILFFHLKEESDHASPAQLAGALTAVALLVLFAATAGRRRAPAGEGRAPAPPLLCAAALVGGLAFDFQPPSWTGVAFQAVLLTAVCAGVRYAARRPGWRPSHVAALGTGVLAARGITGFFTEPLGDVSAAAQLGHNIVLLAGVLALGVCGVRGLRPRGRGKEGRPRS